MLSRRILLAGLGAMIAAPSIIRPGTLMPINPALVPSYRLVQLGAEWHGGYEAAAFDALLRTIAHRGLVFHNEAPPILENSITNLVVRGLAKFRHTEGVFGAPPGASHPIFESRLDVLCRDYSTPV